MVNLGSYGPGHGWFHILSEDGQSFCSVAGEKKVGVEKKLLRSTPLHCTKRYELETWPNPRSRNSEGPCEPEARLYIYIINDLKLLYCKNVQSTQANAARQTALFPESLKRPECTISLVRVLIAVSCVIIVSFGVYLPDIGQSRICATVACDGSCMVSGLNPGA